MKILVFLEEFSYLPFLLFNHSIRNITERFVLFLKSSGYIKILDWNTTCDNKSHAAGQEETFNFSYFRVHSPRFFWRWSSTWPLLWSFIDSHFTALSTLKFFLSSNLIKGEGKRIQKHILGILHLQLSSTLAKSFSHDSFSERNWEVTESNVFMTFFSFLSTSARAKSLKGN